MLGLILTLVLIWLALVVLLYAGTLWFQGYIYSEPAEDLYWRAPAASTAIALFVALWCFLNYRTPGQYGNLLEFSAADDKDYPRFWSVKRGQKTLFERRKTGERAAVQYVDEQGRPWVRERDGIVEALVVEEDGKEVRFKADLNPDGTFKQPVRYLEEGGRREMTEAQLGRVSTSRRGLLAAYMLLNLFHLALWFACLWLLLRFQWPHALGLAVIFWIVMTLLVMTQLLTKVEAVARQRVAQPARRA